MIKVTIKINHDLYLVIKALANTNGLLLTTVANDLLEKGLRHDLNLAHDDTSLKGLLADVRSGEVEIHNICVGRRLILCLYMHPLKMYMPG